MLYNDDGTDCASECKPFKMEIMLFQNHRFSFISFILMLSSAIFGIFDSPNEFNNTYLSGIERLFPWRSKKYHIILSVKWQGIDCRLTVSFPLSFYFYCKCGENSSMHALHLEMHITESTRNWVIIILLVRGGCFCKYLNTAYVHILMSAGLNWLLRRTSIRTLQRMSWVRCICIL